MRLFKCNDLYWIYINKKGKQPTCIKRWYEWYPNMIHEENIWAGIFKLPFTICRETKLQSFQFRVLHRIIPCRKWLTDIKILASNKCEFCDLEDNLIHFLIRCNKVQQFWSCFINWWTRTTNISIAIENIEECIIFGFQEKGTDIDMLNYCVLLGKFYIYTKRLYHECNLDIYEYLVTLKQRLRMEKIICYNENKRDKFNKWIHIYEHL